MTAAHFTICGDFMTDTARGLMLDDEPGRAWRLLADSLIGEGAADVVRKVLDGTMRLTGDSVNGIGMEDDTESEDYLASLRYLYAGRFRCNGRWYRPRAVVTCYGPEDARAAGPCPTKRGLTQWSQRRAEFYAAPGEHVAVCKVDIGEGRRAYHTIFEPCGEMPQWWKPKYTAQTAANAWAAAGRGFAQVGATPEDRNETDPWITRRQARETPEEEAAREAAELAEDERREAEMLRIGKLVREQAGDDVFPMTLLDGRIVQVPRAPFTRWALRSLTDFRPSVKLPPWTPVSESGWKMYNDDPNHTDWIFGAGLTVSEGYDRNVSEPAWDIASEMQIAEVDRGDS